MLLWDIAGSLNYRQVWHSYIGDADLIVFMIDGADLGKREDVESALKGVMANDRIGSKTLLFLINKNVSNL